MSAERCILVIFGASGDLTKRLLIPSLYNLMVDGLLPDQFAVVGMAMDALTTDEFRDRMSKDIQQFKTSPQVDELVWQNLCARLHYVPGKFDDGVAFQNLRRQVELLDRQHDAGGNVLFYLATPPSLFGLLSTNLELAGFKDLPGWKRLIVEKPFGTDLQSARALNRQLLSHWTEDQIYRVDHYLGKETVQNILAFRFANGMFEPLWNHQHIDHIQLTVSEAVSVEGRADYYDKSGVLRDMIQNHMFQVLSYVCMEAPASLTADEVRDQKARLLQSVRVYTRDEAVANSARGQYGAGTKANGQPCPDYRHEPGVAPNSATETFAALKLFIDNPRWQGVPIYLRSGKALWARGTDVVVQFKQPEGALFHAPDSGAPTANRLIFHIQPDQAIEIRFQAKVPGPTTQLQGVNMRFAYGGAFKASRSTGYEVKLYRCMMGDPTLFLRTDLIESAWTIAQPFLDGWAANPPMDFPNYSAGTWGPQSAHELLLRDGRDWFENINSETLQRVPLFRDGDELLLGQVGMALRPRSARAGDTIIQRGDVGHEMFVVCHGQVEVVDDQGNALATLGAGSCFGEVALLTDAPRNATVRARVPCNLVVLDRADFRRILREHGQFAARIESIARERYGCAVTAAGLIA
jgi:glucose-6-phosphate 1-dehydrogenase